MTLHYRDDSFRLEFCSTRSGPQLNPQSGKGHFSFLVAMVSVAVRAMTFTTLSSIVIATIAFGMSLDCTCVREVIHWGPSDVDSYM